MEDKKEILNQIIKKKDLICNLEKEISDLENVFSGFSFEYDGEEFNINFIDAIAGDVNLTINDGNYKYNQIISLYDLSNVI